MYFLIPDLFFKYVKKLCYVPLFFGFVMFIVNFGHAFDKKTVAFQFLCTSYFYFLFLFIILFIFCECFFLLEEHLDEFGKKKKKQKQKKRTKENLDEDCKTKRQKALST